MPQLYPLPDFSGGVNLLNDPRRIADNQTLRTKNLVPYAKGVLEKRKGSALYLDIGDDVLKVNAVEVVKIGTDKYVIAVGNRAAGDKIYFSKNGAAFAEMTGTTTLSANQNYSIAVDHLNAIYIVNGTDAVQVSTDGETRADMLYDDQTRNGKYAFWWKDRLFLADVDNNAIYFSENLAPTNYLVASVLYPGSKDPNNPMTGIIPLAMTSATEGLINFLLVLRKNSLWVIGFGTAPDSIDQLSGTIGCWDDKSVCATPYGIIFVGKETVYQVGTSGEPQAVGNMIKPVWDGSHATRGRNTTYRTAAAIYFNGFVRFSYPETEIYNNREYYLDVRDFSNVGWFGDHSGLYLNCYAADGTTLYGGSSVDGKVISLDQDLYTDSSTAIAVELQTKLYTIDNSEYTTKIFKRYGFNVMADATTSITVNHVIDEGRITGSKAHIITVTGSLWDTAVWDVDVWSVGSVFQLIKGFFRPSDRGRYIQYTLTESSQYKISVSTGLMSWLPSGRVL